MAAAVRESLGQREIQVSVEIEVRPLNAVIRCKQWAAFTQHIRERAVAVHEQVCARMGFQAVHVGADVQVQESVIVGIAP